MVNFYISNMSEPNWQLLSEYLESTGGFLTADSNMTVHCAANGYPTPTFQVKIQNRRIDFTGPFNKTDSFRMNDLFSSWISFATGNLYESGEQSLTCFASKKSISIHIKIPGMFLQSSL